MRLLSLALAMVAMVVVLAAGPGHVLENVTGPSHDAPAATQAQVRAEILADAHLTDWDHHLHGHVCADHCAAHVLNLAPESPALKPTPLVRTAWRLPGGAEGRSIAQGPPTRPPWA